MDELTKLTATVELYQTGVISLSVATLFILWNNFKARVELGRQRKAINELSTAMNAVKDNLVEHVLQTEHRFSGSDGVMNAIMGGLHQFDERLGSLEPQIKDQTDEA